MTQPTAPKVVTPNAVRCGICGGPGDLIEAGIYVCRDNPAHMGDRFVGIWSDLTHPADRGETTP